MKSSFVLAFLLAACAADPSTAATRTPSAAAPPSVATAKAGYDLLPGGECKPAAMPSWTYDPATHVARLSTGSLKAKLPAGWDATLERPDLVVVSAPRAVLGVRPTFELFVSPICETYESVVAHGRVAGRGLSDLLPPDATAQQVADGSWSAGMGGPVGVSLILYDVSLKTPKGERVVAVYLTDLGDNTAFGVHAAAVCPKQKAGDHAAGPCEKAYFAMLESAQ